MKKLKIMTLVFGGAYLSGMLAELQGIDAEKIESIDALNFELGQKLSTVSKLEESLN